MPPDLKTDRAALRQALLSPRSVAIVGQSDDPGKDHRQAAAFPAADGLSRRRLSGECPARHRDGRARLPLDRGAAGGARPRLPRGADRSRDRHGGRMRQGRGEGRQHFGSGFLRNRRGRRRARTAAARGRGRDRHPHRRAVLPRRDQHARRRDADRQRGVFRTGHSGRPHLRGLALRHHDRRADVARQSQGHRLRGAGFGRQRDRRLGRRDLPLARSTIRTSTATCCSSKPSATRPRCASSRWARPSAASLWSPTSSAARRPRASLP